jgi:eukaryotic-like serine/threonine-protein kinase
VPETADPQLQARVAQVIAPAFVVEGEIGRGGNGIVYKARDVRLKRTVAVKLLPPELAYRAEIRTRFLQEAQTAAQLSHPNIVPIYTVDERDGLVYFVMGFVDGESLGGRLRAHGPIAAPESKRILREVGEALSYAHARGVIHRDIKPDNILLDLDGRAMVTDFGIARAIDESTGGGTRLTATGMAIGTPAYMSPEQCAGDRTIDGRSDLYSLGVVGYQMLSGLPPFTGSSTPALLIKQISEAPVPLRERRPDVPEPLARIIMALLAKAPNDRFADARAFVVALDGGPVPEAAAQPVASAIAAAPAPFAPAGTAPVAPPPLPAVFSAADVARWNEPKVVKFRRRFRTFVAVNAVIVIIALFGNSDLLSVTAIWSMLEAYWYARLWADGFDWRDVFKQPRDRFFFDVAAEAIDDTRAMFDKKRRGEVRERERQRQLQLKVTEERATPTLPAPRTGVPTAAGVPAAAQGSANNPEALRQQAREARRAEKAAARVGGGDAISQEAAALVAPEVLNGAHGAIVKRAVADRAAVREIYEKLGPADRALLPNDVVPTVNGLVDRIASLATALQRLDVEVTPDAIPSLDARIAAATAEPASPDRERKLALLKRTRASLGDLADRRAAMFGQLENAGLGLQNLRFDLLKLRSHGVQSALDDVTSATQEARALSREIGHVLNVAEELKAI